MAVKKSSEKHSHEIPLKRVVWTSFLFNFSDLLLNVVTAYLSGSITMASRALSGGADLLSSGLLLVGVKQSEKPADAKHPYGYGRELYFWTFISGLVTFGITAILSIRWGFDRFLNPEPISNLPLSYFVLIFAFFTNLYAFSLSYKRLLGKKSISRIFEIFRHSALIETKTTFVLDLMGVTASLLGMTALLIFGATGDLRFDGIGAMMTGVALAFFAFFILMGAKELLVGQSASFETVESIKKATESFPEVHKVLDLRTILLGSDKILINIEVHVKDGLTTDEIEQLIDRVEKKIKEVIGFNAHIQIELETPDV